MMEEALIRHAGAAAALHAADDITPDQLKKSLRRPRSAFSMLMSLLTTLMTFTATVPLFSVVFMLLARGLSRIGWPTISSSGFSWPVFMETPPAGQDIGGGFGNALLGTAIIVGVATLLAVPIGILAAIFLAEVAPGSKLAQVVRFGAKVLSGFPSILAGVLAYGLVVVPMGGASALAGGVALFVLMLPTVLLTAEDALRMVPARIKEASIGMGATNCQTIWRVLVPTAMPGILTGVMLAVARAAGETAPLLFTALFSYQWVFSLTRNTPSLSVLIYNFSQSAVEDQQNLAWAAAAILVLIVLGINLIGQSFSKRTE